MYILKLINIKLHLDPRQYGFRKASSTSHAFCVYEEARRQLDKEGKKGFVIFLDFSKAFDKVTRSKLMVSLIGDLGALEWYALVRYYEVGKVKVFIHKLNMDLEEFATIVGVKQGGPFSPTAFNKYINKLIIRLIDSGELVVIRRVKGGCIVYADDTTVVTDSAEKMHRIIVLFAVFYYAFFLGRKNA